MLNVTLIVFVKDLRAWVIEKNARFISNNICVTKYKNALSVLKLIISASFIKICNQTLFYEFRVKFKDLFAKKIFYEREGKQENPEVTRHS